MYQGNSDPKQMFLFPPSQSLSRSSKTLKGGRGGIKREGAKRLSPATQPTNTKKKKKKHNKLSSSSNSSSKLQEISGQFLSSFFFFIIHYFKIDSVSFPEVLPKAFSPHG